MTDLSISSPGIAVPVAVSDGGTGQTSLANVTGTANQVVVSGGTGRVIGGNVALSLPQDIHSSATPTFAGETLNGNLTFGTAGNGILVKEGTNATMGTATLVNGTVIAATTKVTASSRIQLTAQDGTANIGSLWVSGRNVGQDFTISSTNILDSRLVAWVIVEPA